MPQAICLHCGESFEATRSTAKFCSEAHKKAHQRRVLAGQKAPKAWPYLRGEKAYLYPLENTGSYVPLKGSSSIPKDKFHPDNKTAAEAIDRAPRTLSAQAARILGTRLAWDAIGHAW